MYEKNRSNIKQYREWIETWANELYRILKPGGFCLVFNSNRTIGHVQVALEDCGFYSRDILIWRRNSGIPKGLNAYEKLKQKGDKNYTQWLGWHSCLRNEYEGIVVVQKPLENNYLNTLEKYNIGLFKVDLGNGFQSNILEGFKQDKKSETNIHITVKPLELMKHLVKMTTPINETVLDCFMGSGTTGLACKQLGFSFIGIEKNKEYFEIAKERIGEKCEY